MNMRNDGDLGEESSDSTGTASTIGRRRFLWFVGAAGLTVAVGSQMDVAMTGGQAGAPDPVSALEASGLSSSVLRLSRRDDQLDLQFVLWNLRVDTSSGTARLVRIDSGQHAFISVDFGPQSLAEQSFVETAGNGGEVLPTTPVQARIAKPSVLVFDVTAAATAGIPYTLDALLGWVAFNPRLVPNARSAGTRSLRAPIEANGVQVPETALELPWRLILSPDESAGWAHSVAPVHHGGWTELWHTRLARRREGDQTVVEDEGMPPVRAVWASDPDFATWLANPSTVPTTETSDDGFRASLTPRNRYDIVRLSSDFSLQGAQPQLPAPLKVESLALSSLGASLEVRGSWNMTAPVNGYFTNRLEWQHTTNLGRDHKVRVVTAGYLFPFGQPASLVTVIERKFQRAGADRRGPRGAYLRRRTFLVIRDPSRDYAHDPAMPDGGRKLPFRKLQAMTKTTPDLAPATEFVSTSPGSFVPTLDDGTPFQFQFSGTDWEGRDTNFSAPAVFVSAEGAANADHLAKVMNRYNTLLPPDDQRRVGRVRGKRIAMAAPTKPGDTAFDVDLIVFAGAALANNTSQASRIANDLPPFLPVLHRCTGRVPNLNGLTGSDTASSVFEYFNVYVNQGFSATVNPGAVFLGSVAGLPKAALAFASEMSGGIVSPKLAINGLSKALGPVGGELASAARNMFNPSDVFALVDAKILGGLSLKDILAQITTTQAEARQAISTVTEEVRDVASQLERIDTRLQWSPRLAAGPGNTGMFVPGPNSGLEIDARMTSRVLPSPDATYTIRGELRDFTVNLWGNGTSRFISIQFALLKFTQTKGGKPDFDCDVTDVGFHGPLSFLSDLADLCSFTGMPSGGGAPTGVSSARAETDSSADAAEGDGSADERWIDVTPSGIAIKRSFAIPTIALGFFSLSELTIAAGLVLPFDGDPARLKFGLNTRDRPFSLTVSLLGGGGFVGIELGLNGVEMLEFALEFGAGAAFSIGGIVSGAVEIKGGIYYGITTGDDGVQHAELTAYVRMAGALSVLGLVNVSALLYIGLSYQSDPDRLVGEALLSVRVEVLFWEKTFQFTVRREFAKGGSGAASGGTAALADARSSARSTARSGDTAAIAAATPTFVDMFTQQDWQQYCSAFAPVGA